MTKTLSREDCAGLDAADPLAPFLARFRRPRGLLYFDGNSLGMLPWAASRRVVEALEKEWGEGLIESWTEAGWIELPERVGAKIARLIGAEADEVIATDSTSINLFKLLAGGPQASARPARDPDRGRQFPDRHLYGRGAGPSPGRCRGAAGRGYRGGHHRRCGGGALTHVDYRSCRAGTTWRRSPLPPMPRAR